MEAGRKCRHLFFCGQCPVYIDVTIKVADMHVLISQKMCIRFFMKGKESNEEK